MMCPNRSTRGKAGLALAALLLSSSASVAAQTSPLTDQLLQPGPHGVGVATLPLVDPTRPTPPNDTYPGSSVRSLVTEVWYPAADPSADEVVGADVAVTPEKFPLIVHGHGFGSSRVQVRFLAKHLATHGYIVAAPDYPLSNGDAPGGPTTADLQGQVGDMIFISQVLLAPATQQGFPPAAQIDPELLAFSGHSFGALTSVLAGQFAGDVAYLMAPPACGLFLPGGPGTSLSIPSFTIAGDADPVTPFDLNIIPLFEAVGEPKYLVQIINGSHLGFVDSAPLIEASFPGPVDNFLCGNFSEVDDPNAEACGLCTELPTTAQLSTVRQLDLTMATGLAFFDGYLRGRALPRAYLKHILERENAELVVSFAGELGLGGGE